MRRAVFFQSRDGKLGGKQTTDFKQISLIGCADVSLNDRVDSMERPCFHELLRLWPIPFVSHREGAVSAARTPLLLRLMYSKLITVIMNLSYLCGYVFDLSSQNSFLTCGLPTRVIFHFSVPISNKI